MRHHTLGGSICFRQLDRTNGAPSNWSPASSLVQLESRDIENALYLGWLAVDDAWRGHGLARRLVEAAADHATALSYASLTLDTGKPLVELQATFQRLGFEFSVPLHETQGEIVTMVRPL